VTTITKERFPRAAQRIPHKIDSATERKVRKQLAKGIGILKVREVARHRDRRSTAHLQRAWLKETWPFLCCAKFYVSTRPLGSRFSQNCASPLPIGIRGLILRVGSRMLGEKRNRMSSLPSAPARLNANSFPAAFRRSEKVCSPCVESGAFLLCPIVPLIDPDYARPASAQVVQHRLGTSRRTPGRCNPVASIRAQLSTSAIL
jgi:hypothetical protein